MKKIDIVNLYNAFNKEKTKGSVHFRYDMIKNSNVIKSEIDALAEVEKDMNEPLKPYNAERAKIIEKIGTKAANGGYSIEVTDKARMYKFNKAMEPVKEKYKKVLDEHEKKLKEYENILQEEIKTPFNFTEVKIDDCPEEIETNSLELFMKFGIVK